MATLAGSEYVFKKGSSPRTLLLLHGTGGDENNLLSLAEELDSSANVLSPRGQVVEDGMLRFFKRESPGVFDERDLAFRTNELSAFVDAAAAERDLDASQIVGVGYSNGANILLRLIFQKSLMGAMLLRPMSAALLKSAENHDLNQVPVFIASGIVDEMIPAQDYRSIVAALESANSLVTTHTSEAGHRLTQSDIDAARGWLSAI